MNKLPNVLDRLSFWILLLVLTLLPVFLLPFTKIPIETSKGLLFIVGLALAIIFWSAGRLSDNQITLSKSLPLFLGGVIVLVFLISAIFASNSPISFFGTMFDMGTFWFIFAGFLLMFMSSVIFRDSKSAKMVLFGVVISSFVVLLFQVLHLFTPDTAYFGLVLGKTENILGSWNAFGMFAGLSVLVALFMVEFFPTSKEIRLALIALILLSLFFIAAVNFSLVWILVGIFSLIIFVYKISLSSRAVDGQASGFRFPTFAFATLIISLFFFMSGNFVGGYLPNLFKISNNEITPSVTSTFSVAKGVYGKNPVLGIGPNRFADAWAMYKPNSVNSTQFWDVSFNAGSGLIPTFVATTGFLGLLSWLAFLLTFLIVGFKKIFLSIKNRAGGEPAIFFFASLYLLSVCLFYSAGIVIFLLSLAFAGIFIGLSSAGREKEEISISFADSRKTFPITLVLVVLMIFSAALLFKYIERFASIPSFVRAVNATDIPIAESSISKAITLHSNDLYLRTYAQIYTNKLNFLLSKGASLTDVEKASLQPTFDQAIGGATSAILYNDMNYLNLQMLGSVYFTAMTLGVEGASSKAVDALTKASVLNPINPRLKLALANIYAADGKIKEAKDFAGEALALKANYIDAFVVLSQIARSEGNNTSAISYAERALSFAPTNPELIQYLNSLKNPSSPPAPAQAN